MSDSIRWEPVEDGDINTWVSVEDNGRRISVYVDDDRYAEETLPEGYAVCRATPAPVPQPVEMPDGVRRTIQGLLEAACSGRESVIRTRKDFGLHFRDAQLVLAEYHAALAWLDQQRPGEGG